jgi:hypothetical protein
LPARRRRGAAPRAGGRCGLVAVVLPLASRPAASRLTAWR